MFVQVIRGQVSDPEQLTAGAPGWLGSTAGVTEDGRFVALARFESQEAARRNRDRPEQGQWWMETSKLVHRGRPHSAKAATSPPMLPATGHHGLRAGDAVPQQRS
jgi:hypothetical protein